MIYPDRLKASQAVLKIIEPAITLIERDGYICAQWKNWRGGVITKKWSTGGKGTSFYPVFRDLPTGGTHTIAICQLANWCRGRACLPIQTWRHWASPTVAFKGGAEFLPILEAAGYPDGWRCCECGSTNKRLDWFNGTGLKCLRGCNNEA